MLRYISCVILVLSAVSCAYDPYRVTNRVYKKQAKSLSKVLRSQPQEWANDSVLKPGFWAGTVNFGLRKPNFVVLHHTAQNSCEQTLRTFTLERTQVSAHYVICRNGTVHHMLNDYFRAWHAGAGSWGSNTDINSSSIGIELDNNGFEPFPEAQINSLLSLLGTLKRNYSIPPANFIGHADIAPNRKNDPSILFPWKLLAENGFGRWYGDTTGISVPESFSPKQALRLIGYNTADSSAALVAFKRHWMQDSTAALTEADKKVLLLLSQ